MFPLSDFDFTFTTLILSHILIFSKNIYKCHPFFNIGFSYILVVKIYVYKWYVLLNLDFDMVYRTAILQEYNVDI